MLRALLLLALTSLFTVQTGTADLFEAICDEPCTDESPLGCPGDEGCCSCCFHPRTEIPSAMPAGPALLTWSDVLPAEVAVPVPAPREILHVPKSFLA